MVRSQSLLCLKRGFLIDKMDTPRSRSTNKLLAPIAVVVVILILLGIFALRKSNQSPSTAVNADNKVEIQKPKATQTLNKEYAFPLTDATGKEVSKFKYTLESTELRDEIVVKGKRAVAVKGRTFFVVNLKINNSYSKTISINSRDYVRLTVNNSPDKLAADIHNDPVEIQPDSTKETRLGFPINESDKNLTLIVGELNGKKETIKLNLR